jgi:hypothetical protein
MQLTELSAGDRLLKPDTKATLKVIFLVFRPLSNISIHQFTCARPEVHQTSANLVYSPLMGRPECTKTQTTSNNQDKSSMDALGDLNITLDLWTAKDLRAYKERFLPKGA